MSKAVVLFNLGGPESLDSVPIFLSNMFNDKAILGLPNPFRYLLAKLIVKLRTKKAKRIYAQIGGKSTIHEETRRQAQALQEELDKANKNEYKVFIYQRYSNPTAIDTAKAVQAYDPEEVILLSLYPQYSTTTTASSIKQWEETANQIGLSKPTKKVCCYPNLEGFIDANVEMIKSEYKSATKFGHPLVLFSAHGIPVNRVEKGDPYQAHVEMTAKSIHTKLVNSVGQIDATICYQSKVGPLKWLGPDTESMIIKAAQEKRPVIIVPIAFVSEHSETLVELDIEYRELYYEQGGTYYFRVRTVSANPIFIKGLAWLVLNYVEKNCSYNKCSCKMLV